MTRPAMVLALLAVLAAAPACAQDDPPRRSHAVQRPDDGTVALEVAGRTVRVELARDDAERARGLMHRTSLGPDEGMLFLFTREAFRDFWMKDTLIPLDIVFLDERGCVINVRRGAPGVERPGYTSLAPARFVLELNAGWCEQHGLVAGDCIEIGEDLRAQAEPSAGR